MSFHVYQEQPEKEKDKDTIENVYLRLIERDGHPILIACDKDGNKLENGNLLFINKEGQLKLCRAVNENLGFKLDDEGRLLLEDE